MCDHSYTKMLIKERAEESPNYFMCSKKAVNRLSEKARREADNILKDFLEFFAGDVGIDIVPREHEIVWSIAATLTVNGNAVKTEDPCDLLFLELNELIMKRMLESGYVSFGRVGNDKTGDH